MERRCESRGKNIIRFRMEKIMQCDNLIVHMFHVLCTFVHIYTWCMCVPMELSTDCKLHNYIDENLATYIVHNYVHPLS